MKKIGVFLGILGIILASISCKSILRSSGNYNDGISYTGEQVAQGSNQGSDSDFSIFRQTGSTTYTAIQEPEFLSSKVIARRILLNSLISGCSSISVPPSLSEDKQDGDYTYAPLSKIPPLLVDTACFPYKVAVSYKCSDDVLCFEGSSEVSIEDLIDIPEELKVPVKLNSVSDTGSQKEAQITVDLIPMNSMVRVVDFFNEECINLEFSNQKHQPRGFKIKVLDDCYDSFYKSYSVDGFEYDMFDAPSEEHLVRCDRAVRKSKNLSNLDSGDKLIFIKSLNVDGRSYHGKELDYSELIMSISVDKNFSIGYQRAENVNGNLRCYQGNKSWKRIDL